MTLNHVGRSVRRSDALAKVTGAATYVADIKVPRMLHAGVLRAGVPHARIRSIDTSGAAGMPGVVRVVTGRDCTLLYGLGLRDQPPLAVDKVRHAGEGVAVVVADTTARAAAALEKIRVDYDPLPFVLDPIEAASPGAPILHERNGAYRHESTTVHPEAGTNIFQHYRLRNGDVTRGFAEADVVMEERFEFPLSSHCALEPHGAICRFQPDGGLEVWASSQSPFVVRDLLAEMFALPAAKVRVRVPYLGGGFGGKSDVTLEPMVAYAASFVPGHAVKLVLSRREVFTSALVGRGMKGRMKIGTKGDGTFTALEAELHFSAGAYGDTAWPICTVAGHNCTGPYAFPRVKVDSYGVYTNSPPVGAFRGYGHPEGHFMVGRMVDMLARRLALPVREVMERNLLGEGKRNALGQTVRGDDGDLRQCLSRVHEAVHASGPRDEDEGYLHGRGLAAVMKSPNMLPGASSGCLLSISPDGSVSVSLGGVEMGQGSRTVFAQMAAEALRIPVESVRVHEEVDTQFSPWEWQTVASMQTYRGGLAIRQACRRAVDRLRANAAEAFDCRPDEVGYDGACFLRADPDRRLSIGALARGYRFEDGLTVGVPVHTTGSHRIEGMTERDPETGMGNAAGSWTFGCQGAEVRVEKATGRVEVLHVASAFDPGRVVNPAACRGQAVGAVVQGLGAALMERLDFTGVGVIGNAALGPYRVPRIEDIPGKQTVTFVETPNEKGPWSAKPIGEHPIVGVAPAVVNAIGDAVGVDFNRLPVTAEVILEALRSRETSSQEES